MFTKKLGVIGVGVMGQAIMECVLHKDVLRNEDIAVFDVIREKTAPFVDKYLICESAQELVNTAEYVLIAIKPQHFSSLVENVKFNVENTIISIMAGTTIQTLRSAINISNISIARVMPNTPCKIGKGVCALCCDNIPEEKQEFIIKILSSCGEVLPIQEELFDTVTSVSGSGPAYVYMFMDGMIKGGMNGGLSYEESKKLTVNTLIGTALLASNSSEPLDELTEKVCSKGGTTIEAVKVFREKGLIELLQEGIAACRKRSEELSKSK